ncbi:hypothetical protein A3F66_06085 [candidate division TM6 bacterium RIFCSPHIGHO2_12_FULL_32_22]|nr:MAG: hypothetical protein A3F66_06085 [candidate division TM6 bacterium RIFCSPHIGHO2_12_FULL_32_22]
MSIYKHYTIVIHKKSEKFLDTIPIEDQKKCIKKIDSLTNDNYKTLNIKKLKSYKNLYRISVDMYRIIFYPDNKELKIFIVLIGPRKHIYNKLKNLSPF